MTVLNHRNPFWDTLKAILIVLVVLGHTGTALGDHWLSVVYAFHMPLFVFISGFFSKKTELKDMHLGRLISIFIFFDLVYLAIDVMLAAEFTIARLFTPSFAMWYIWALVIWRIMLCVIPFEIVRNWKVLLSFSFFLAIVAGFIPLGNELSFQRLCTFLPFFLLGYYARQYDFQSKIEGVDKRLVLFLLIVFAVFTYFCLPVFYANEPYKSLEDCGMRFVQLFVALIFSILLIRIIPKSLGRFTDLGRFTLLIYLLHPSIIKIMKLLCKQVGIQQNPIIAIIMTVSTVYVIYAVRNVKVLKYLK